MKVNRMSHTVAPRDVACLRVVWMGHQDNLHALMSHAQLCGFERAE